MSEQLAGAGRILREVVAPAVSGAYPADILAGLVATLDALAAGWADVPAFMVWDAARTVEMLEAAAPELTEANRSALRDAASDDVSAFDLRALEAHHARVRAVLADVVASGAPPALVRAFGEHARQRAERYPLDVAHRMPGQR
jgi:hypothetical protein